MSDSGSVIAWIGLALALVGGLLALLRYINAEIAQERKWREEANALSREQREKIISDLANYKLEATEKFASHSAIEKTEQRLLLAMEKLGARQETMLGRMETIQAEIAKRRST